MKHLYYPCTARLYTVLCIYKLWSVHYILYIWRHFVQHKTIVRKTWLMLQQQYCYFFSDSKHCCTLLFSEALLHAQPSPFSFDFPEVLWPCGNYLQLGLVRNCLSHIQQTCYGREGPGHPWEVSTEQACESHCNHPPAFTHCATLLTPGMWKWIQLYDCCAQTSQPMIWLIHC